MAGHDSDTTLDPDGPREPDVTLDPEVTLDPDATLHLEGTLDTDGTLEPAREGVAVAHLAGRYAVHELLGKGGSGQVHRAVDALTGQSVAVKFVRALSSLEQDRLRRELTALRLLSLPGVVRLRDDGTHRGEVFLVMDLLTRHTIRHLAGPWFGWADAARRLVETLSRVHFAGVLHRDLKPSNILLDAQGQPVITDFGIALGRGIEEVQGLREGTPRYVAPEQWAGTPCDERADLYSLGVVLWELLVCERFPDGEDARPALRATAAPASVRAVIEAMIAVDPDDRPASASDVLVALGGGDAVLGPLPSWPDPVPRSAVRALVDESQPTFLHLAEDVATLLLDAHDGRSEVQETLASWIRRGRCHWVGDRLHFDRSTLSALRWDADPSAPVLVGLARLSAPEELAASASAISEVAWSSGDPGRALGVLEQVLGLLEGTAATSVRHELAARSLFLNDPDTLRRVRYRAERAGDAPLALLLRGVRACRDQEMSRAASHLARVAGLPQELELWRIAWLCRALARADPERRDALLADVEASCAANPLHQARWLGWRGTAHYLGGRFHQALADHAAAAQLLLPHPVERLPAMLNAAAAAIEAVELTEAERLASEAREIARELRHAVAESGACLLRRSALYRAGRTTGSQPGYVDAAAAISLSHAAQHGMVEAAIAWRAGEVQAADLALGAAAVYQQLGHGARALALGLAIAAGAAADPREVVALASAAGFPSLSLQAVALGAPGEASELPITEWIAGWHLPDPEARADVLSLSECVSRLRG